MSHKLQIDLLRAHLRLSIADLQDSQIQGRHQQVLLLPSLPLSLTLTILIS